MLHLSYIWSDITWFFFKPFIFPEGLEDTPFTLLNSHCSGYCISFLKNVFKIFPLPLLCLECFLKLHNLGHSSKNSFCTSKAEYEWIYVTKKSSSMNFVPGFSQQEYPTSIQSSNISNLSIKYTFLDHCAILCSAHNCKSYGNATSYLRGSTVPA